MANLDPFYCAGNRGHRTFRQFVTLMRTLDAKGAVISYRETERSGVICATCKKPASKVEYERQTMGG